MSNDGQGIGCVDPKVTQYLSGLVVAHHLASLVESLPITAARSAGDAALDDDPVTEPGGGKKGQSFQLDSKGGVDGWLRAFR